MRVRFTLADLLWLSLVVALAVEWWLDHRRIAADAANQVSALKLQMMLTQDEARQSFKQNDAFQSQLVQRQPESPIDNMPIMRPRAEATPMPNTLPPGDGN
jgi:hypothetical protein